MKSGIEPSNGVTVSEVPGLMPIGRPAPASSVPEPDTDALVLAGLGLLACVARRRRRKEAAVA